MAIDDIFQFTIHGACEGQPVQQVFHYLLFSATSGQLDFQAALTALNTKWTAGLRALLSTDYTLYRITLQLVAKFNAPTTKARSLLAEFIVNLDGQVASSPLPPQCAFYTKLIGVSSNDLYFRGAKYWGGIPANAQVGGLMNNAYLNDFNTFLGNALTDVSVPGADGGTLRPVIWSKKRYKTNQIPYLCVITNWNVEPSVKTQRRRTLATAAGPI